MARDADEDQTDEQSKNYFRLARLTMTEGTNAVRTCVLERLPHGETLHSILAKNRRKMDDLWKRKIITDRQWKVLYPANTNADLSSIDITLWIILLRNIIQSSNNARINWNQTPDVNDNEWFHDVMRIRETRNNLFHINRPEIDYDTFENQWNFIAGALRRLNVNVDVDMYRSMEVKHMDAVKVIHQEIIQQVLQENNNRLQEELETRRHHVQAILIFITIVFALVAAVVIALFYIFRGPTTCDHYALYTPVGTKGALKFIPHDAWTDTKGHVADMDPIDNPVPFVAYSHTADTGECIVTQECCLQVKNMQYMQMFDRYHWADISYHYLIDSQGMVYIGRPTNKAAATIHGFNRKILSVAVIGNYQYSQPTGNSLGSLEILLSYMLEHDNLNSAYRLYAACQLNTTSSPGKLLYDAVNSLSSDTYPNIANHRVKLTRNETHCPFD